MVSLTVCGCLPSLYILWSINVHKAVSITMSIFQRLHGNTQHLGYKVKLSITDLSQLLALLH